MTKEDVAHALGQLPANIETAFADAANDGLIQKLQTDVVAENLRWQASAEGIDALEAEQD